MKTNKMRAIVVSAACAAMAACAADVKGARAKKHEPFGDELLVHVKSSLDGTMQPCWFWAPEKAKSEAVPLVVGLHTWSPDYKMKSNYAPAFEYARKNGWAMVGPNFRGPNKTPPACGGDPAVQDIVDAVNYAKSHAKIDEKRVYIIGGSGGGHMTLLMAGRHPEIWAGCVAFCPITDLARWHSDSLEEHPGREKNYARMLEKSCGGTPSERPWEYVLRSPLTWLGRARDAGLPVYICTGIHDGWRGSVPVGHSVRAYNALADAADRVSETDMSFMEKNQAAPERLAFDGCDPFYGESRRIHLQKTQKNRRFPGSPLQVLLERREADHQKKLRRAGSRGCKYHLYQQPRMELSAQVPVNLFFTFQSCILLPRRW